MEVKQVDTKELWEQFVLSRSEANFLQSWQWGVFQQALGKAVIRLGIESDGQIIGVVQAIYEPAKRGSYLAVAGGPLLDWHQQQASTLFWQALKQEAQDLNCIFIRVRPQLLDSTQARHQMAAAGFQVAPMHLTADLTIELDLTLSDEELLAQMRKNTRSSVRRADRVGITTTLSTDPQQIQRFYRDQLQLAKKHGFVPFSYEFWHEQFKAFLADDNVVLIDSFSSKGELLASAFIIFYNQQAFYHYGTSTPANAKLPGSYAVQWRAIVEAKARNCNRYNLWGVAPRGDNDHRFSGVSLFKRGFGGQEVAYLPAHDLPVSSSYQLTRSFEIIRKKMRHL